MKIRLKVDETNARRDVLPCNISSSWTTISLWWWHRYHPSWMVRCTRTNVRMNFVPLTAPTNEKLRSNYV